MSYKIENLKGLFMRDFIKLWDMFAALDWTNNKAAILRYANDFCYLYPVENLPVLEKKQLIGIQEYYDILEKNTFNFCNNKPATNALLWGARGCGKSSIVKAICYAYTSLYPLLRIFEIESKDISMLPLLFDCMRKSEYKFIVFCDDLTFMPNTEIYQGLKSAIDGSILQQATNIIVYATSNLRHLVAENAESNMLHTQDCVHELLALSDRFPLQISFYNHGQKEYLATLSHIIQQENPLLTQDIQAKIMQEIKQDSLNFATKIGNANPRTAKNYYMIHYNKIMKLIADNT